MKGAQQRLGRAPGAAMPQPGQRAILGQAPARYREAGRCRAENFEEISSVGHKFGVTPFGGKKATVNGHREAGTQVLDIFSEWKSLYVDYSGKLQKAQIDAVEI